MYMQLISSSSLFLANKKRKEEGRKGKKKKWCHHQSTTPPTFFKRGPQNAPFLSQLPERSPRSLTLVFSEEVGFY